MKKDKLGSNFTLGEYEKIAKELEGRQKVRNYIETSFIVMEEMEKTINVLKHLDEIRDTLTKEDFDFIHEVFGEEKVNEIESKYDKLWSELRKIL